MVYWIAPGACSKQISQLRENVLYIYFYQSTHNFDHYSFTVSSGLPYWTRAKLFFFQTTFRKESILTFQVQYIPLNAVAKEVLASHQMALITIKLSQAQGGGRG